MNRQDRLRQEAAAISAGHVSSSPRIRLFAEKVAAALEVGPPTLDVMVLRRALECGLAAVDDEWTIEELAELSATKYVRLAREKTT